VLRDGILSSIHLKDESSGVRRVVQERIAALQQKCAHKIGSLFRYWWTQSSDVEADSSEWRFEFWAAWNTFA
jgi:hypothetical protein